MMGALDGIEKGTCAKENLSISGGNEGQRY